MAEALEEMLGEGRQDLVHGKAKDNGGPKMHR